MNVKNAEFPVDVKEKATSVFVETGMHIPRVKFVREYLMRHEKHYRVFEKMGFEPILRRWKELADIFGREVVVEMVDKTYTGKVQGIDPDGFLILKDPQGAFHRILSGDVLFV
jgi:BirA family biotin operon repressor/biotin-[acetyl-CoA-carboxylase] ligase